MRRLGVVTVAALLVTACSASPVQSPTLGNLGTPSPNVSQPAVEWPPFVPRAIQEAVAAALGMSCTAVDQRIHCTTTRPSGARFDSEGPDGTVASDSELSFTASGPQELEVEAHRLFATVSDAVALSPELSAAWQDRIWADVQSGNAQPGTLPNGVSWSASRQVVGDVLVWSLSLTW